MKRKVLLVDDEKEILELLEATLRNDGTVEVFVARDGEEGLRLAQELKPDLVFLDVLMPKRNGYEVCQALKKDPATASVKVVILTGLSQEFDREKALIEVGADGYFAKPFSPIALLEKAEEFLAGRR